MRKAKTPVPIGFRGWDYVRFIRQKKEDANWTCSLCGWHPDDNNDRVNIVAHHPDKSKLFDVIIICEACHYKIHWEKL